MGFVLHEERGVGRMTTDPAGMPAHCTLAGRTLVEAVVAVPLPWSQHLVCCWCHS